LAFNRAFQIIVAVSSSDLAFFTCLSKTQSYCKLGIILWSSALKLNPNDYLIWRFDEERRGFSKKVAD
jgi:hypothetical protein